MERFLRGGSLGRSLTRNLAEGLNDHLDKPCMAEMQETEGKFINSDDGSRISLRVSSKTTATTAKKK